MKRSEALKTAIDYLKLKKMASSGKDVAEKMGADASNISRSINGKPEPSESFIKRFNAAFGGMFNEAWLLNGEGDMLADGSDSNTLYIPSNAVPSVEMSEVEYAGRNHYDGIFYRDKNTGQLYISVPHVPYAARGEFPNEADSLEPFSEWGREVYKVDKKASGKYISFDVKGNSMDNGMHKSLQDGDKVLVRELERDNWRTLRAGDHRFWVLVFGTSVLIKEISSFDPSTGVITCHSLNPSPEYHDFTLPLDSVRHLYYVIKHKPIEVSYI